MHNDLFRIIAKPDVLKFHIAAKIGDIHRMLSCLIFFSLLQKLEDTFTSRRCRLKHVGHLSNLLDRLCKIADILEKGLNIAHFNGFFDHHKTTQNGHHHITQITDKLHHRHHGTRQKLGFPCGAVQFLIDFFEIRNHIFFLIKHAYHMVTAVNLFNLSVDLPQILLLSPEIFLGMAHDHQHKSHGNRKDQKCRHGHKNIDAEHHSQHTNHGGH